GTRTAGLEALHIARLRIASGRTKRAIVVASEEDSPVVGEAYRAWGLEEREEFLTAGGAVALILESASSLAARGGRALAWLEGSGLACEDGSLAESGALRADRRLFEALAAQGAGGDSPAFALAQGPAWPGVLERGLAEIVGCDVQEGPPWQGVELFSVGPLAALAAAALGGRRAFGFAVDFHGPVAAAAVRPAGDRAGGGGSKGLP